MKKRKIHLDIASYSIEPLEDERFSRIRMYVCHTGVNNNKSSFSFDVLDEAKDSIVNIPILAHIDESINDFGEHEVEYDDDEDKIIYIEKPIGVVPAINHNYHYDDIDDKTYVVIYGYIWNIYSADASEIIHRDKEIKLSMEIIIDSFKFDYNTDILTVEKFRYTGITLLGKKYGTGMIGAKAQLQNYSLKDTDFTEKVSELNSFLMRFNANTNIDDLKKEGEVVPKSKNEIATLFSLTAMQLYDELRKEICKVKFLDRYWDGEAYECSKYYIRDYDENYVYVVDCENGYMDMKIPYSKDGDNVVFQYDQASRIKYTPTDWEDGSEEVEFQSYVQIIKEDVREVFISELEKFKQEKVELEQNFEQEKQTFSAKVDELQEAVFGMTKQIESYSQEKEAKDAKIVELEKFKAEILEQENQAKVNDLFKEYSAYFSAEEIDSLKNRKDDFASFEMFEKEVKSMVTDRMIAHFKQDGSSLRTFVEIPSADNKGEGNESDVFAKLNRKFN